MRRDFRSERGASEGFMIMMMVALLAFAGLAYDAGMAFNARREATNIASSAARAGADEIDTNILYAFGRTVLDTGPARSTARNAVITAGGNPVEVSIRGPQEIFVRVERTHTTVFLGAIGIDSFEVEGEAIARVEGRAR